MRVENIEITMRIPLPMNGKPDRNGTIYSKEIIEKTVREQVNLEALPICYRDNKNGNPNVCIGIVKNAEVEGDNLIVHGRLFRGGTDELISVDKQSMEYYAVGIGSIL